MSEQLMKWPTSFSPSGCDSQRPVGLSLVLATLGRTDEISRLFKSVVVGRDAPVEVIVVDQNSDDRLTTALAVGRALGLDIQQLRIAPRRGLSLARNEGLRHVRYSIVAFPDDDCWYESNVCQSVIDKFAARPRIDGLVARWGDRHDGQGPGQLLNPDRQRSFAGIPIASICLFLRTDAVIAVGGFDENLGVGTWAGSSEETDLVFRLLEKEHQFEYCPDILVRHHWPGTAIPMAGKLTSVLNGAMLRARGTGAMYSKHALDSVVVFKGLLAPFVKALGFGGGMRGIAYWFGTALGRWQGFLRWRRLRPQESEYE
jgi:glycosyltransferase involved in cell wall biosynthesis